MDYKPYLIIMLGLLRAELDLGVPYLALSAVLQHLSKGNFFPTNLCMRNYCNLGNTVITS